MFNAISGSPRNLSPACDATSIQSMRSRDRRKCSRVAHPRCGRCSATASLLCSGASTYTRGLVSRDAPPFPTGQTTREAIARDGEYPDGWSASETVTFLAAARGERRSRSRARAHARQRERAVGPVPRKEAYSTEREEVLLLRRPGPGGDRDDATRAACNFVGQVATRALLSNEKPDSTLPPLSLYLSPLLSFPRTENHQEFNSGIAIVFTIDKTTRVVSLCSYIRMSQTRLTARLEKTRGKGGEKVNAAPLRPVNKLGLARDECFEHSVNGMFTLAAPSTYVRTHSRNGARDPDSAPPVLIPTYTCGWTVALDSACPPPSLFPRRVLVSRVEKETLTYLSARVCTCVSACPQILLSLSFSPPSTRLVAERAIQCGKRIHRSAVAARLDDRPPPRCSSSRSLS